VNTTPGGTVTKPRIVKTVRFDLTFEQDNDDPSKPGIAEIRQVVVNDGETTPPGTIQFFNPLNLLQQQPPPPPVREHEPNSKKWTHGELKQIQSKNQPLSPLIVFSVEHLKLLLQFVVYQSQTPTNCP
jgi:hypothetical protein